MKDMGFKNYINNWTNRNDQLIFFTFVLYNILRHNDLQTTIPVEAKIIEGDTGEADAFARTFAMQSVLTILNLMISIMLTFRMLYLVLVYEELGKLVQLVTQCLTDVRAFCIFYMFFISIFYLCFEISGAEFPSKDYSSMPPEFMSWMDIFRNSIGDI